MKKVFKVLGIILLIIVIVVVGFIIVMLHHQNAPGKYWETIKSDGAIETKYNSLGGYTVAKKTYDAPKDDRDANKNHFVVWYPEEEGTYPLVIMVNGSGTPCNKYEAVFEHFASWGYVVVGNDYGTNWDGKHPSETLDFALNTEEIASIIDKDRIAIGGHSQGGEGTFNAITEYENGALYDIAFSLSPTNNDLGLGLQWGFKLGTEEQYAFRLGEVNIPMMIVAGTGKFDAETVTPLSELQEMYDSLPGDKVAFRRGEDTDHGAILYEANGYVIAWLDYYLKDVTDNQSAFFGEDAEIAFNARYQDFYSQKADEE